MSAVTRAMKTLSRITAGGAFPYVIERCVTCENDSLILYVLVVRFLDTNEYDVRPYVSAGTRRGIDYEACWVVAAEYILDERLLLKQQGKKVTWSVLPREFERFPSPHVPASFCDGKDWGPILNAVLRDRVW